MGKRQETLLTLLGSQMEKAVSRYRIDVKIIFASAYAEEVIRIYRQLGGISAATFRHTGWDIELETSVVELDEELHFNSYRLQTLSSPIYAQIPGFPPEGVSPLLLIARTSMSSTRSAWRVLD